MATKKLFLLFVVASLLLCSDNVAVKGATSTDGLQTYIVHVLPLDNSNMLEAEYKARQEDYYRSFLPTSITTATKSNTTASSSSSSSSSSSALIYTYQEVLSGFAARLTADELKEMEKKEGFLYAYPDSILQTFTTSSPDFLGLDVGSGLWKDSNMGEGIIIGVIDSGYSPDHPSFKDDGTMPPPPSKWEGVCDPENLCNNKVIGVRTFVSSSSSALDRSGHGTHTASTAAGTMVNDASVLGLAKGTASGIAPRAHIAIYKVCDADLGCICADIVAGIDRAVQDKVDILSISIGSESKPFYNDAIAVATFRAAEKGVFVCTAAGNSGPDDQSITNDAPWMLTVGASTTDRELRSTVSLENNENGKTMSVDGQALFQPGDYASPSVEIVIASNSEGFCNDDDAFDGVNLFRKIAFCRGRGGITSRNVQLLNARGAAGLIVTNDYEDGYTTFVATQLVIPSSFVTNGDGNEISDFVQLANPGTTTGSITFQGTVFGVSPSPTVASFSSRGPSANNKFIIKPDIIGPGVNILAAWNSSIMNSATQPPYFNVISGTSMATPHISGIAALLKSLHPDWSPSAIKSAIMTTANILDRDGNPLGNQLYLPATFFEMGAGHVNPFDAADPGLVYETESEDYYPFLCGLGYNDDQVSAIVRRNVSCFTSGAISQSNLNYPSIAISLPYNAVGERKIYRTVTNVGPASSTYKVEVDDILIASVKVEPETLEFSEVNEKIEFVVTFTRNEHVSQTVFQGYLRWTSAHHVVRSPLYVALE